MEDAKTLLEARVRDAFLIASERGYAKFTPFLNEDESFFAQKLIQKNRYENYLFFGGSEGNTRRMLGAFPSYLEPDPAEFPIASLTAEYPVGYALSHRDFLGSLMGLQIKRDAVGDIFPGEGWCVFFVRESVREVVLEQLTKVGRVGVRVVPGIRHELPSHAKFEPVSGTVASLRLDCVVALLSRLSREKASAAIQLGTVQVNHETAQSCSLALKPGDILSIRGCGKFLLADEVKQTKKGWLFITGKKYI